MAYSCVHVTALNGKARPADGCRLNADLALGVLHAMLADFGSTSPRLPICVF